MRKLQEWVDKQIAGIEADERYHAKPALVQVNAPLALLQVQMKARMGVLKTVKELMEGEEDVG